MSYFSDVDDVTRGAATYINEILKGAKPADLPVEHFEVPPHRQSQNRQGTRDHDPAIGAGARG
jgi:hypothetical protein